MPRSWQAGGGRFPIVGGLCGGCGLVAGLVIDNDLLTACLWPCVVSAGGCVAARWRAAVCEPNTVHAPPAAAVRGVGLVIHCLPQRSRWDGVQQGTHCSLLAQQKRLTDCDV